LPVVFFQGRSFFERFLPLSTPSHGPLSSPPEASPPSQRSPRFPPPLLISPVRKATFSLIPVRDFALSTTSPWPTGFFLRTTKPPLVLPILFFNFVCQGPFATNSHTMLLSDHFPHGRHFLPVFCIFPLVFKFLLPRDVFRDSSLTVRSPARYFLSLHFVVAPVLASFLPSQNLPNICPSLCFTVLRLFQTIVVQRCVFVFTAIAAPLSPSPNFPPGFLNFLRNSARTCHHCPSR